jgi:hypothetical protein
VQGICSEFGGEEKGCECREAGMEEEEMTGPWWFGMLSAPGSVPGPEASGSVIGVSWVRSRASALVFALRVAGRASCGGRAWL